MASVRKQSITGGGGGEGGVSWSPIGSIMEKDSVRTPRVQQHVLHEVASKEFICSKDMDAYTWNKRHNTLIVVCQQLSLIYLN